MAIPNKKQFSIDVHGKTLTLEVSALAGHASAAVLAKYGGTVVLATVVMAHHDAKVDYLPLRVDYEERFYAAGKILGSRFIRREGRPSEDAILSGRVVDRTIRPLFDHRLRRDIQVVITVVAYDEENDPDFVGLMGASAALAISDVPWAGPVAGVRVVKKGGEMLVNPNRTSYEGAPDFMFETFVTGPHNTINMIEFGGSEASEEEIMAAFTLAQKENNRLIAFLESVVKEIGKPKAVVVPFTVDDETKKIIHAFLEPKVEAAFYQPTKLDQERTMHDLHKELVVHCAGKSPLIDEKMMYAVSEEIIDEMVHKNILEKEKRPDGRSIDKVRELFSDVALFERTHGSAIFARGTTQALAVATLAAPGAEQLIETMEQTSKRRFMLHYNFPPYSVGEVGPFRGPGRREIGHGALAEKAIRQVLPTKEEFPYTIRVVSEILSSNGSSSMATVCAATLSLMDAGVPLKKPVAGIAMGLMSDDAGNYKVLTDLQGPEDHYGDMDFKVAGTKDGVTAVQLDVKVRGLTLEMAAHTLSQARVARLQILEFMNGVLSLPRASLSPYVPAIQQIKINPDKIGMVIGPGGKMINGLIKKYELAGIDIDEDGSVFVSGTNKANVDQAVAEIRGMTREFAIGEMIEGTIIKVLDFGAIVDLGGGQDGMIHVSELKEGFTKNVGDVVKLGDFVRAKIIKVEDGRIGLSLKNLQ